METTLYRKYRPTNFENLFGQEFIKQSIINSLNENKMAHAYLFSGPRGVGKTTIARIIAKGLNCEKNGISANPCLECENCKAIASSYSLDVTEIDAASNRGIEEIRALKENVNYRPVKFRKKVYIIDEVHMLTNEAFNALLKTLEEPPEYVIFILATTEIHKLPETIISRCVTYNFKNLSEKEILDLLRYCTKNENINIDDESLKLIYKKSNGGARDSLSLLEQVSSAYINKAITLNDTEIALGVIPNEYLKNFNELLKSKNKKDIINFIDDLYIKAYNIENFLKDFCDYLENNESDIDYCVKIINIIYEAFSLLKNEDNIRIISYIIIQRICIDEKVERVNININSDEIAFDFDKLLKFLKSNSLTNFSTALSEFKFVEIKNHIIYLKQTTNRKITRAFLENEYNLRRLEEAIYNMLKVRYKIYFMENNINNVDDGFVNKVKSLFDIERI